MQFPRKQQPGLGEKQRDTTRSMYTIFYLAMALASSRLDETAKPDSKLTPSTKCKDLLPGTPREKKVKIPTADNSMQVPQRRLGGCGAGFYTSPDFNA